MDLFPDKSVPDEQNERSDNGLAPLAERLRPATLDEVVGQDEVVGRDRPLRQAIEKDRVPSLIFWGPPGSGKTTIARLIARTTEGQFIPFSAVVSGIKEVKTVLAKAGDYYRMSGRRTYVFIDEIHRFNKAQQDAFLPYVESGEIVLIGATTENPSFEVNSALLSRMQVHVLKRLDDESLQSIVRRALEDAERGLGEMHLEADDKAVELIASLADGDARRALTVTEACADYVGSGGRLTPEIVSQVQRKGIAVYDKSGENHFDLISALHKSVRGGDPDAALYWLARMLHGGEDPLYLARRMIRMAVEDIGLADPYALTLAIGARDAFHFLGSPEGDLALAELVVYLACAPKSNAIYTAYGQAKEDAERHGSQPVPLWLRNAPTGLMKSLGYGDGYQYAHDFDSAVTAQDYFPEEVGQKQYYRPTARGREKKIGDYLAQYHKIRRELKSRKGREQT
ncbi:AAA family ATPase [candidate division GN15 bacterium]|nr:AAA family ATPase [candidate division GN15 bacterium]